MAKRDLFMQLLMMETYSEVHDTSSKKLSRENTTEEKRAAVT